MTTKTRSQTLRHFNIMSSKTVKRRIANRLQRANTTEQQKVEQVSDLKGHLKQRLNEKHDEHSQGKKSLSQVDLSLLPPLNT